MKEKWASINGYEDIYKISTYGNVLSLNYGKRGYQKILKNKIDMKGYNFINLYKNGIAKPHKIHRLVAKAFIPNKENKPEVNHINEIKNDNRVNNLNWMTRKENNNYGDRTNKAIESLTNNLKLSKIVLQYDLKGNFIKEWPSTMEAHRNGYSSTKISYCCRGIRNKHKNSIWSYK